MASALPAFEVRAGVHRRDPSADTPRIRPLAQLRGRDQGGRSRRAIELRRVRPHVVEPCLDVGSAQEAVPEPQSRIESYHANADADEDLVASLTGGKLRTE